VLNPAVAASELQRLGPYERDHFSVLLPRSRFVQALRAAGGSLDERASSGVISSAWDFSARFNFRVARLSDRNFSDCKRDSLDER
jgi:hypothetical protein